MWNSYTKKLSNSDKEEFRRIINLLLSQNFIIRDGTIPGGHDEDKPRVQVCRAEF